MSFIIPMWPRGIYTFCRRVQSDISLFFSNDFMTDIQYHLPELLHRNAVSEASLALNIKRHKTAHLP